ncbi:hypothetical protein MIMGU_mgv1a0212151mg, partial [Erythranthe guttata]
MTDIV